MQQPEYLPGEGDRRAARPARGPTGARPDRRELNRMLGKLAPATW